MTAVALLVALAVAAPAAPGLFDGKWSSAPGSCARAQDSEDAPVLIKNGRYDQHEAHCRWGALAPAGKDAWTAKGSCSVEGSPTRGNFRFKLAGAELTMVGPDGVASKYRRCPVK